MGNEKLTRSQRLREADTKLDQIRSMLWALQNVRGGNAMVEDFSLEDVNSYLVHYCSVAIALTWEVHELTWPVYRELEEAEAETEEEGQSHGTA